MRRGWWWGVLVVCWLWPGRGSGEVLRFALLVGAGHVEGLPRLQGVDEALTGIRAGLERHGEFPAAHIVALAEPTVEQFRAGVSELGRRIRGVRQVTGAHVILLCYFYGHSQDSQLYLARGKLGKHDLATELQRLDADLKLVFVDACYGDIPLAVAPSNFLEIPEELLAAEGTIWFSSTSPNQLAFEPREGGPALMTAAFIDGLTRARADAIGISLESFWQYIDDRVRDQARRRELIQQPHRSLRLRQFYPIYMTFRHGRTARLALAPPLEGHFLLEYHGGGPAQVFSKVAGAPLEVAIHPGSVRLMGRLADRVMWFPDESVAPGSQLVVAARPPPVAVGYEVTLGAARNETPGERPPGPWQLYHLTPAYSLDLMVGYELGGAPAGLLVPEQLAMVQLSVHRGAGYGGLGVGRGQASSIYPAWRYDLWSVSTRLSGGYSRPLGPLRVTLGGQLGLDRLLQQFGNDAQRGLWLLRAGVEGSLIWQVVERLALELYATGGPAFAPQEDVAQLQRWTGWGAGGARVRVRLDAPRHQEPNGRESHAQ